MKSDQASALAYAEEPRFNGSRNTSMKDTQGKISFGEKLSYGLGDTASNFFFQFFNIFLLNYYTDVFGISAGAVSIMFLATKLWDTVNDPMMGIIADRTNTKYGKFRPYLLWMAIPYGVLGYAMFVNVGFGESGKLVYAYVTYTLMLMVYTAINVPYGALMGVMSTSSNQRTSLNTYRFACAFLATLLLGMFVRPLVRTLGGGNEVHGFQSTMAIFAVVSVMLFFVTFKGTKERVQPMKNQQMDVWGDLKALFKNTPWVVMVICGVFTLTNVAVRGGGTVYFFKYYIGDDNSPYLWFMDMTSVFLTTGTIAFILGVFATRLLSPRFDKRLLMIVLTIGNAIMMGALYFVPAERFWTMVVVNAIASLLAGPTPALVWSMYADVADYGEWRYARRSTALVFSAAQFAQKLGLTLGAAIPGLILWYIGYVANAEQTRESLFGIRIMFTFLPAAFALLAGISVIFYPLRDRQLKDIESELKERRSAQGA